MISSASTPSSTMAIRLSSGSATLMSIFFIIGLFSFGCGKGVASLYMISVAHAKICFPQKEALGISTLNEGLITSRKPDPFELIEVTSGGKQRIIAAEKDAARAHDFKGDSVNEGTTGKRR